MTFNYKQLSLAATWILVVMTAGLFAPVGSAMGWFVVSIVALAPCLVMLHFSQAVPQTTSEISNDARR